jgi:pimeloyl-ACP methyl ester carboxylesterase
MALNHVRRGAGEPLLLLHSLGGSLSQWNPVMDRLARWHEVIAVDMPGFGRSPLPPGRALTARNLAGDVLAFVDSLGLGARPGVAGISLGSWVAIECGRQGGVSSVVALCPAGFWKEPLAPRRRNTAYDASRRIAPIAPLLLRSASVRHRVVATNVHRPERVPLDDAISLVQSYGRGRGYPNASAEMRAATVGDLSGLDVPLTIAWAEFDQLVRNKPLPDGVLPDWVRQVRLPGCGHVPTWDDPELVTRVILEGTNPGSAAKSPRSSRDSVGTL